MKTEKTYQEDEPEVNRILLERGIRSTIHELRNPEIHPEAADLLLELFKRPYGGEMLKVIAVALFRRPMSAEQREQAVQICLEICRRGIEKPYSGAEIIAGNELAENAGPHHVDKIGEMLLDKGLGERRGVFTRALGIVGNADAISYLRAGGRDAEIANWAITELARLLPPLEAIQICDAALALENLRYRKNIEETRTKLQRKLKRLEPVHLSTELAPEGLEEWSANIDGTWLPKITQVVRKIVDRGFGRSESAEIRTVMDDMIPGEVKTLKFEVTFAGKATDLWAQISCDDEDAFDFYIFALPELIQRISSGIRLK